MRILFNSKKKEYKDPFGCLTPGQECTLNIQIPQSVGTSGVRVVLTYENGRLYREVPMEFSRQEGLFDLWSAQFSLDAPGLYFYYFSITGHTGTFRLFKYGDDTNMEDGGCWQVSCIPADFTVPDWAKGAVMYQVFPDRFCKEGDCDLTGKLNPFVLHESWEEEVFWQPNETGEILNNDFYGGNFRGITKKLPYLAELGVGILYLNPIGKAFSSHRYDTADYKTPDPMLGTLADFKTLCETAHSLGIRVILDGVYSHTGADSVYFNKYGNFGAGGAYRDPGSPFASWYNFFHYPNGYNSWWGFDTLPTVKKMDGGFLDYIIRDDDSVVAHWLNLGADGFRLDVADELPGEFLAMLKKRIRELKPDALLIGEVWEDASNKISYNTRCRYFVDGVLDSVMNYPFRSAILDFVRGAIGADALAEQVMTILENYPAQVIACNMNLLGSHDTPRLLTALSDPFDGSREQLAQRFLTPEQKKRGKTLLFLASVLQFTLPGCPCIYYGDEALMEGHKDPFNRRPYPWGKEDAETIAHYRALGQLRKRSSALQTGETEFTYAQGGHLSFVRKTADQRAEVFVNCSDTSWTLPDGEVLKPLSFRIWEG